MAAKPHLNVVYIGHVDHGKSTLVGRTLLETGAIAPHVIEKFRKQAEEKGKATFEFAWVMDSLKEERERGVTIDVAHKKFDTDKYFFTVIDAPGHRDFVKNMITGTSQADSAVVVVSAKDGVQAQTKEHIFLAKTLGVPQYIVAVNKMDAVNFDQAVFDKVSKEVMGLMKNVGIKEADVKFIPVSALKGDGVKEAGGLGWYKGPTLLKGLDMFREVPKPTDKPLRIPIQDVYSITGIGTVPVGRVETGVAKPNMKIFIEPAGKPAEIKSVEMHHESVPEAIPGDNIGFNVRGIAKNDIKRGDVVGTPESPPSVARTFKAQMVILQHPSAITAGYTPVFHCHTAQVACIFEELLKKIDPKTGQVKEENPSFLKTGDIAVVKVRPTKPLAIETSKEFPQLGRFAIRDMGQTVAAGLCIEIEKR